MLLSIGGGFLVLSVLVIFVKRQLESEKERLRIAQEEHETRMRLNRNRLTRGAVECIICLNEVPCIVVA
jgi:hypothetical protein